jgi:two-component system response regulator HydG
MARRPRGSVLVLPAPGDADAARASAEASGLEATVVRSVSELFTELRRAEWTATVVSLSIEPVDPEIVRRIAEERAAGALFLTAAGFSLDAALAAEQAGAVALLREPLDASEVAARLASLLDELSNEGRDVQLRAHPAASAGETERVLIGTSRVMGPVFETIARVASSDTTVLVTGESGTGKEIVARTLHRAGSRRAGPFVAVNCAAIPDNLLESELFGHERGAFTGAVARRTGRFERAHGGTLFLDEIGDMSLVLQAKVLRVIEERSLERVGGEGERSIDVRVIAATNKDLVEATRAGTFREDLYFRLAVVEVRLPPLRERGEDVRELALHFGARFAERHGRPTRAISERALRQLQDAPWPGNVRELRNVMDRAVLLAAGTTIRSSDLRLGPATPRSSARAAPQPTAGYPPTLSIREIEADHIRRVLAFVNGRLGKAAEMLGVHRNTLAAKVREYGIDPGAEA